MRWAILAVYLNLPNCFTLSCLSPCCYPFARMYDRIEQPVLVPLYPGSRAPAPQQQVAAHGAQRSPVCVTPHSSSPGPGQRQGHQPLVNAADLPASRYHNSAPVRGGFTAASSQPRQSAFVPEASIAAACSRSMGQHAQDGDNKWWEGRQDGSGTSERRSSTPLNVHREVSSRASTVPVSRAAEFSDARADQGSSGATAGGVRKAWQRTEGDVRDMAVGKGLATTRYPAVRGAQHPSQQIPAQWRTGGKASAAAAAVAAEAARRGDERRGGAWGNGRTGSWR